jgi:hypothetical protein
MLLGFARRSTTLKTCRAWSMTGNIVESTWRHGRDHPESAGFDEADERALGSGTTGRVWFRAG